MSNEPTIEQMGLVIARFMGMEGSDEFIRQNYKYHASWDLLYPVFVKFRELKIGINERIGHGMRVKLIINVIGYETIERTHKEIFNAIQ